MHCSSKKLRSLLTTCVAALVVLAGGAVCTVVAPAAHADAVAYLVNVTVRPGYHFTGADDALRHGHAICDKVAQGATYATIMSDVIADLDASDDYQAAYLINQAVNELCPAQIWQLRNSATLDRGNR